MENRKICLEIDTTRDGISAWKKDFHDAKDIMDLLLGIAPEQTEKVRDFVTRTVNFGEAHVVLPCEEMDFSKYGFEKLSPA